MAEANPRPIFLTGFMGVGKSTVARALAKILGWKAVDTDELVEKSSGLSIPEFFNKHGEAAFRDLEKKIVQEVAASPRAVVSLGGGALMDHDSFEALNKNGVIIFLDARVETIEARLNAAGQNRPLLAGLNAEERTKKIRALMQARRESYLRATHRLETDAQSAKSLALEIQSLLNLKVSK